MHTYYDFEDTQSDQRSFCGQDYFATLIRSICFFLFFLFLFSIVILDTEADYLARNATVYIVLPRFQFSARPAARTRRSLRAAAQRDPHAAISLSALISPLFFFFLFSRECVTRVRLTATTTLIQRQALDGRCVYRVSQNPLRAFFLVNDRYSLADSETNGNSNTKKNSNTKVS